MQTPALATKRALRMLRIKILNQFSLFFVITRLTETVLGMHCSCNGVALMNILQMCCELELAKPGQISWSRVVQPIAPSKPCPAKDHTLRPARFVR